MVVVVEVVGVRVGVGEVVPGSDDRVGGVAQWQPETPKRERGVQRPSDE